MEGPTMKARLLGVVALLFDYFRKICTVAHDQFLSLSRRRLLVSITAGVLAALFLFWFVDKVIYYFLVRSYIDQVADVLDLNKHLINSLALASAHRAGEELSDRGSARIRKVAGHNISGRNHLQRWYLANRRGVRR